MNWTYHRRTKNCASLSCSGSYVISHRPGQHIVSYRPTGQHHHVGEYQTWQSAKVAAATHATNLAKGTRRGHNASATKAV